MAESIVPFTFESRNVPVYLDDHGNPWWEAQDVCAILSIKSVSDAVTRLKPNEKRPLGHLANSPSGKTQTALIINEKGLYRLIMRSNKPEAERFQEWVFGEVLPAIHRTGRYVITSSSPPALTLPQELTTALAQVVQTFQFQATVNHQVEARLISHETTIARVEQRMEQLEAAVDNKPGFMTLMGYTRLKKFRLTLADARTYGQDLRKKAKTLGITLGKIPDERWGTVNSYPVEMLDEFFVDQFPTRGFSIEEDGIRYEVSP